MGGGRVGEEGRDGWEKGGEVKLNREQQAQLNPLTHGLHGGSLCEGTVELGAGHQLRLGEKLPALKTETGADAQSC